MVSESYVRPNTDWLAHAGWGISVHWTAKSCPVWGASKGFGDAVDDFDVVRFVERVASSGARYLLFTATHAIQHLPAPCSAIDRILPGRTTSRDLLMELADACARAGLYFIVYYNHSCNRADDPLWERACGYHDADKAHLVDNLCDIVAELGIRYGKKVRAWWFDSSPSLDPSGPHNSVSTDMTGFRFPWERFTRAAKAGLVDRLVTYNPGMQAHERLHLYTECQDYLSGEVNDMIDIPTDRFADNGLQNHRWVCLDNPAWVHAISNTPLTPARYGLSEISSYLRAAKSALTPGTFNLDVDQAGLLRPETLALLRQASA